MKTLKRMVMALAIFYTAGKVWYLMMRKERLESQYAKALADLDHVEDAYIYSVMSKNTKPV